jgi:hypothetical protein
MQIQYSAFIQIYDLGVILLPLSIGQPFTVLWVCMDWLVTVLNLFLTNPNPKRCKWFLTIERGIPDRLNFTLYFHFKCLPPFRHIRRDCNNRGTTISMQLPVM